MQYFSYPFKAMGSPCEFQLYAQSKAHANEAIHAAHDEVRRLESKYSRYLDDSVTTSINSGAGSSSAVQVDEETAKLLDYAAVAHEQSDGLFDITSGILRKAWNFREPRLPEQSLIDALLPYVGWSKVEWCNSKIYLPHEEMEIDFGGYVKEYAVDTVAGVLYEHEIRHGVVDLGGDLKVVGPHPDGNAWKVGIRHPRSPENAIATVSLSEGAIASSGDYERFIEVEGKRYAHVLDPRTGWPVSGLAGVSVLSQQCLLAGTSTTIAILKGMEAGLAWLDALQIPYLAIDTDLNFYGSLDSNPVDD